MNTAQQAHYGTMAMEFYQEEYGKVLRALSLKESDLQKLHEDLNNLDNSRQEIVQALSMVVSLWEHNVWERTNPAVLDVISQAKTLLYELPPHPIFNTSATLQTSGTTLL